MKSKLDIVGLVVDCGYARVVAPAFCESSPLVYIMAQVVKSDADSSNDCVTLSRAEYDELLALRSSNSKSSVAEVVCSAGDGLSAQGGRWVIDSGASGHLCGNSSNFLSLKPVTGQKGVRLTDGSSSPIVGQGNMSITPTLQLSHVLHAPSFPQNLLSVSRMTKELNCRVIFDPMGCTFQDLLTGRRIGGGYEEGGLYYLHQPEVSAHSAVTSSSSPLLWHHRLGHLPVTKLRRVIPHIPPSVSFQCETCQLGKHCRSSFPSSQSPSSQGLFDLLHVDVWGPSRIPNRSQCRYYLVIVDDFSRLSWVFLLKDRSQGPVILKSLIAEIKTQFDICVKIVRTDNALEFKSKDLLQFYSVNGIQPQFTCPHTSQQNGVAERKHRQILNVARCLMIQSNMPATYWGDAVLTAGFLINRMPSSSVEDQIPIQILHPEAPLFPIPLKFLDVCVLCISWVLIEINLLRSLLNVFSLGILRTKKDIVAMTLYLIKSMSVRTLPSLSLFLIFRVLLQGYKRVRVMFFLCQFPLFL